MASIHKQSGKPNWFCAYYDEKGIRRFRTTGTSTKKDAEKLCLGFQKAAELAKAGKLTEDRARKVIEAVVADIIEGSGGELKRYTVDEYFRSWVKSREGTSSSSTHTRYEGIVNSFLNSLGERSRINLNALRSDDVQKYRDSLKEKVSSGTVNTHLKVLRVALSRAVSSKVIETNPAKYVANLGRADKHKRRAFTLAELKMLLDVATADWKTMLLFGLYTGFRLSDIANLTWANLDLTRGEVSVETQKTGKFQILPLSKALLRHIQELPTVDDPAAPLCPKLVDKPEHWLSNQFYSLMASAGLVQARTHEAQENGPGRGARRNQSAITFHSLRHTATSLLKNAGVSDVITRDIIGHESEAISRNYTHIDDATKRKAIDAMPDVLK